MPLIRIMVVCFLLTATAFAQDSSDDIVAKAAKVRGLQQSLENGDIDSRAMFDQRQQLDEQEIKDLSAVLTSEQLNLWKSMQNQSSHHSQQSSSK